MPGPHQNFHIAGAKAYARHGHGQVPRSDMQVENAAIMRLVEKPAPKWTVQRWNDKPIYTVRSAVSDLGLSAADESDWARYLADIIGSSPIEAQMRQQLMVRLREEDWDQQRREVMFRRAMSLYRNSKAEKSMSRPTAQQYLTMSRAGRVHAFYAMTPADRTALQSEIAEMREMAKSERVYTVDELHKAMSARGETRSQRSKAEQCSKMEKADRGGTYHRRVAKPGGGYRYFYDPDKYNRSKGAHQSGEDVKKAAMGRHLQQAIESAGDGGCDAKSLEGLAKRYGTKEVLEHLRGQCKSGALKYSKGKFYKGGR